MAIGIKHLILMINHYRKKYRKTGLVTAIKNPPSELSKKEFESYRTKEAYKQDKKNRFGKNF